MATWLRQDQRLGRVGVTGARGATGAAGATVTEDLRLRQACEQTLTSAQFLAQARRHVISRPQTVQGLLGKADLLPLKLLESDFIDEETEGASVLRRVDIQGHVEG